MSARSHADAPRTHADDWLLLFLLVILWGSAFGLTEIALRGFSPIQVVTARLWIGALVLVVLMVMSAERIPRDSRTWTYLLAMSVLGNVLPFYLISWGQQAISSALTGILMAVMPLVVLVLAHFLVPGERLNGLDQAAGQYGFFAREDKKALKEAAKAPAPSGFGGFAGGKGATFRDLGADEDVAAEGVRNLGKDTLYRRGRVWIAANALDVDPERDKDRIRTVERFSEDYFRLVRDNTARENLILAQQQPGEELIVNLRGQAYRIR